MTDFSPANTQWKQRLEALNHYVSQLGDNAGKQESERNIMRGEFYDHCYSSELHNEKIISCSAPVGLGKTTSVMAYLLRKAIKDKSSRIFVIAPFSNIINQTVKVLRNSVVLDSEDVEKTVVAHHHKADFSDKAMRQYAASWQAPIVVTTAVQFFETMASSDPTQLRKLSAIAGSSIFIDESHACLPVELLNLTWFWLRELSDNWGCNIVFSSGSMVEYWADTQFVGSNTRSLPDLLPEKLRKKIKKAESCRINFDRIESPISLSEIVALLQSSTTWEDAIQDIKPSCMVILNTVQSAAIVADALARSLNDKEKPLQNKKVLHLSTALAPKDREVILAEITRRQGNTEWDEEAWYLIATSCVEAGVDLDFSIGFRERCSVTSFLQVSGRINRHGRRASGVLISFSIIPEDNLIHHPGFKESIIVFDDLWSEIVDPKSVLSDLSTKAIRREFLNSTVESNYLDDSLKKIKYKKQDYSNELLSDESKHNFQTVSANYKVINSNTVTVIIDVKLVEKLELGITVDWQTIQNSSVQLWVNKIDKFKLNTIAGCQKDFIYSWIDKYDYDAQFLGIMASNNFLKNTDGVF